MSKAEWDLVAADPDDYSVNQVRELILKTSIEEIEDIISGVHSTYGGVYFLLLQAVSMEEWINTPGNCFSMMIVSLKMMILLGRHDTRLFSHTMGLLDECLSGDHLILQINTKSLVDQSFYDAARKLAVDDDLYQIRLSISEYDVLGSCDWVNYGGIICKNEDYLCYYIRGTEKIERSFFGERVEWSDFIRVNNALELGYGLFSVLCGSGILL
jgi:hypothetical protein